MQVGAHVKKMKVTIIKYLIYVSLTLLLILFLTDIRLTEEKADSLINLMVSVTSITLAILVTFFFSKLFAERQDRIQRKATIDEYSKKVTALRRIAHRIKEDHEIWKFAPTVKRKLDSEYPSLTVEQFRSLEYEKYSSITKELDGELAPQAYMALRGLENEEQSNFEFYRSFKLENYSLNAIANFKEYCGFFWAFCEEYKSDLTFSNTSSFHLNPIREDFMKIMGRKIDDDNFLKEIMYLFSEFQEKIFPEMYYLTEQNQRRLEYHFMWTIINLIVYIAIMISSIVLFIQPICLWTKRLILMALTSLLIVNTVDLIAGLFMSIPRELNIKEFYKI